MKINIFFKHPFFKTLILLFIISISISFGSVFAATMNEVFDSIIETYRLRLAMEIQIQETGPAQLDDIFEKYDSLCTRMVQGLQKTDSPIAIDYFLKRVFNLPKPAQMAFMPVLKNLNESILSSIGQGLTKDITKSFSRIEFITSITENLRTLPPDESDINDFINNKDSNIKESNNNNLKDSLTSAQDNSLSSKDSKTDSVKISLIKSDSNHSQIQVCLSAPVYATVIKENKKFQIPYIKGCGFTSQIGYPMLPVLRFFLAVPEGSKISSSISDSTSREITNILPLPVQPPLLDIPGYTVPFTQNSKAYSSDILWPNNKVKTSLAGKIRDFKVLLVEINPVRFKGSDNSISIMDKIIFTVKYNTSSNAESMGIRSFRDADDTTPVSADFRTVYKSMFLNSEDLEKSSISRDHSLLRDSDSTQKFNPENGAEYLIITPDQFAGSLEPLAKWKNQRGLYSKIIKTSQIQGADDPENIRRFVQKCYKTFNPKPSYLLLVGDCDILPTFHRVMPTYGAMFGGAIGSDHYYSMIDGNDLFSDIFVGRLSASDPAQVSVMVNKIISYEKTPHTADNSWFKRALSAGYKQDGRIFHETAIAVKDYLTGRGIDCVKTFSWEGDTTDTILNAFNRGLNIVTYRGHGEGDGWVEPSFNINHIESLKNSLKLPVVFSTTCLSGSFDDPDFDCFGEALMKHENGGSVSFLGASKPSYSFYNDEFLLGMMNALYSENITLLGQVISKGQTAMVKKYGLDKKSEDMFEFYSVIGDPSLKIWTKAPVNITIKTPEKISGTTKRFMVQVNFNDQPVEKARVTLASPDYKQYYRARITNSNGRCAFSIPQDLNASSLELTVSGDNIIPQQKSIPLNK